MDGPANTRAPAVVFDDAVRERARSDLQASWLRLRGDLEKRIVDVETFAVALIDGLAAALDPESAAESAGELATLFGRLGIAAGADVARTLAGDIQRGQHVVADIAALIQELRAALATADHDATNIALTGALIAVVGAASDFADRLVWTAPSAGASAIRVMREAASSFDGDDVDAVVVVLDVDELDECRDLLLDIADCAPFAPIVVVSPDGALGPRLAVADLVAEIVPLSVTPDSAVRAARAAIMRRVQTPVVVIGGDPVRSSTIVKVLRRRRIDASQLADASEILATLRSGPHVVVIDRRVDGTPGHVWANAIRTDSTGRRAGIVLIGDDLDRLGRSAARDAGVDEIVPSEASMGELADVVTGVQRRVGQTQLEGDLDGSVAPWHNGRPLIERALLRARRHGWLVAVVMLELDEYVLAEAGMAPHAAAAKVADRLEGEFRTGDVVTWYQPLRFVIVLQQAGWRVGVNRMEGVISTLGLPTGAARAAVTEYPTDAQRLGQLLDAGHAALEESRLESGPSVVATGWHDRAEAAADVVIVDGDAGVTSLLRHTLEGQGQRVVVYEDGISAERHLSGASGAPLPRLLIFDLYLPGISGLELVRRLDRAGTLGRFKSILLTSQSDEAEVLEALELGVDDFVKKPFSTTMLIQRSRRALSGR